MESHDSDELVSTVYMRVSNPSSLSIIYGWIDIKHVVVVNLYGIINPHDTCTQGPAEAICVWIGKRMAHKVHHENLHF